MFVGRFEHALDEKGRIVLPSAFRPALKGGGVLAPWDRCLALWTPTQFDVVAQMIKTKIAEGEGDMDVMRLFFAEARTVAPDGQGRFVVPEEHRAHAALERDAVVSGQFDRIEIWDRRRFTDVRAEKSGQLTDVIQGLRL
ncbi:MAG: division/cell wall cluster transcriptional repressor MraZ [Acidimicrobiales bacterium]